MSMETFIDRAMAVSTVALPAAFAIALIILVVLGVAPPFVLVFAAVSLLAAGLAVCEVRQP